MTRDLDDFKDAWQAADDPAEPVLSDEALLRLVREQAEAFDETIRRRDRRESVAAALVFLFFSTMLLDPSWVVRIGALLVMGSSVLIYWTLRRARTGHTLPDVDRPVAEAIRAERKKVDEQIRLLETVLWWYIAPLATGILLVAAGDAGLSWFTLGYGAVVLALGGGIYYLNQREVRQTLRPRREELTRLLRRVEDGPEH
jgi:protein-S-isoprenylcysteine O-methyltransferase Ste14